LSYFDCIYEQHAMFQVFESPDLFL